MRSLPILGVESRRNRPALFFKLLAAIAVLPATSDAVLGKTCHVWEKVEIVLDAEKPYDNPYTDVEVWVDLKGPGLSKRCYGFWDGGDTFRVRVLATAPGTWTWQSGSNPSDPGLDGKTGNFTATAWTEPEKQQNPCRRGMIGPSANGHAFQYADGTGFFLLGDTWWSMPTFRYPWYDDQRQRPIGPKAGFKDYVRFRKRQQFNGIAMIAAFPNWANDGKPAGLTTAEGTVLRSAWRQPGTQSAKDMHNELGERAFLFPGRIPGYEAIFPDLDRINPKYFHTLDEKIDYLNAQGLVPFIEVARRDIGQGWKGFHRWPDSYTRYIQHVWSRYQANICLFSPIHYDSPGRSIPAEAWNLAANRVIEQYGPPPFGTLAGTNSNPSTLRNFGHVDRARWLTFHQIGNRRTHDLYAYLTEIFNASPPVPGINGEPYYAGMEGHRGGTETSALYCRSAMYGSVLSGGLGGHIYGAGGWDGGLWGGNVEEAAENPIWDVIQWQSADQMRHLKTFVLSEGRRYQDLVPDADLVLPNKSGKAETCLGWAYCARTADRDLFLLYFEKDCPPATLSGTPAEGKYQARWFDPRTGKWVGAGGGILRADATGKLALPAFPGGADKSDTDWALKLTRVTGLHGAERPGKQIAIFRDPSAPPIAFAAGEIRKALEANGFSATEQPLDRLQRRPVRIVLSATVPRVFQSVLPEQIAAATAGLVEQGYVIRATSSTDEGPTCTTYWGISNDPVGAMYAGLDLAESIRLNKGLKATIRTRQRPHVLRRGIKFNIPLDVRTPSYDDTGDAAQKNYEQMWDFSFWREFLDAMARHRYNTLTLWNPHPFPSLVKCPNYPDVALDNVCISTLKPTYQTPMSHDAKFHQRPVFDHLKIVKKMTIDEKIAFWRRVMRHAKDRGIDIYLITWNVLTNGTFGKYGIDNDQDNPTTIAYLRESVCRTILTYPDLAGIGVTAGENMKDRDDEFSREKWLWKTYGLGVLDAKKKQPHRHVRFLHRVWQTGVAGIVDDFGSKYPDTFEVGFKYARAHMYSSPDPPFDDKLCEELQATGVKCWWNLRNDDVFNFRWGDPDYVREFILHLPPKELTAGYHMGSDGYVWGREHTSTEPDSPRQLEIEKHWYKFMLWGRLGYDPKLDAGFFTKLLAARFPETSGPCLYAAWAEASKIIPLVNRFHWSNWDFMWAVEGCLDRRKGFHTVDDFIRIPPMERSGMISIPDFVDRQLAGQPVSETTPIQVAEQLRCHATDTLNRLAEIRRGTPRPTKELRLTLGDVEAMAHLGNYYGAKILGAAELCAFRKSKDTKRKETAIQHLSESVKHWESYAAVAGSQYRPQLLARTRRTDWLKILDEVKQDVEIARNAAAR